MIEHTKNELISLQRPVNINNKATIGPVIANKLLAT